MEYLRNSKVKEEQKSDQHFRVVTDQSELEFGANDLGVWIEKYETKKQEW